MMTKEPALFIAIYTDADVSLELADQLRARGYDAVSALEVGNYRLLDHEQLDYAISQRRAILTFNTKHFKPLFESFWHQNKDHYGIILSDQIELGELLRRTLKLLNAISADEMKNNIKYLGEFAER
jgi:predicted nuclease of predicted toxin-antitoxin system